MSPFFFAFHTFFCYNKIKKELKNKLTEPYFEWSEENGMALCIIYEGDKLYYGTAMCSIEDKDMQSEKVGCEIALARARINYFQGKKAECRIKIEGLKHFKSTLSSNIDKDDYIYKRLLKEIKNLQDKIIYYCCKIDFEKSRLREYINDKEQFYQYLRRRRQGKID